MALRRSGTDKPGGSGRRIDQAVKTLSVTDSPNLITNNQNFHRCLTDGINVEVNSTEEYRGVKHLKVFLVDIDNAGNNVWLALNQLTVIEKVKAGRAAFNRRADVALYKYAYSKVSGDIRNGYVSCDTVADRINGGEWDL